MSNAAISSALKSLSFWRTPSSVLLWLRPSCVRASWPSARPFRPWLRLRRRHPVRQSLGLGIFRRLFFAGAGSGLVSGFTSAWLGERGHFRRRLRAASPRCSRSFLQPDRASGGAFSVFCGAAATRFDRLDIRAWAASSGRRRSRRHSRRFRQAPASWSERAMPFSLAGPSCALLDLRDRLDRTMSTGRLTSATSKSAGLPSDTSAQVRTRAWRTADCSDTALHSERSLLLFLKRYETPGS